MSAAPEAPASTPTAAAHAAATAESLPKPFAIVPSTRPSGGLTLVDAAERVEYRVEQPVCPEANRIVRDEAGGSFGFGDGRARFLLVEPSCVDREAGHLGGTPRQRDRLVELDQLLERRKRVAGIPLDLRGAGLVAEDEGVRHRPVDQSEGDPRVRRMDDRSL